MFERTEVRGLDFQLTLETRSEGRFYVTPEGKHYPSASTVCGLLNRDSIAAWKARVGVEAANKKAKRGADRGTMVHLICEKYLKNELSLQERLGMLPTTKELFLQLKHKLDLHVKKVYAVEQSLYSDRLGIAGRTDGVCLWDSDDAILDIKTAESEKPEEWILHYFTQTAAYAEMWEERTGRPINKLVIAMAVEKDPQPKIYVKDKREYLPILDRCIAQYYRENNLTLG